MNPSENAPEAAGPRRIFLHEPGWRIGMKVGSDREYCYMMAPGQDYYHRLLDGEIYLFRVDERLCFACAQRKGLVSFDPKALKPPTLAVGLEVDRLLEEGGGVALVERPEDGDLA